MQDLENCGKTHNPGIRDPKVTQIRDPRNRQSQKLENLGILRNSRPTKMEVPQNQKSKEGSELTGQER